MHRIGKYEIVSQIGRGGMGVVYRARDSVIGRDVAIKIINENAVASPETLERFYREARSAGRLSHENIATIYDVGAEDGRPYIVMEYLEGADLRDIILSTAGYTSEDKLDIAIQVCQGLHYAHRRGIIHRDIKPDNIRVTSDGRVKILDFGIARIQDDTQLQTLTASGKFVGTPRYMSPEQIRGEKLDVRSDIFSFGVLFYELLAGEAPFTGERVTTLIYKILNVAPEPFTFDPKSISDELHPLLFKCLAKERERRYADFGEVLEDLQPILAHYADREATPRSRELNKTLTNYLEKDRLGSAGSFARGASGSKLNKRLAMWVTAVILAAVAVGYVVLRPGGRQDGGTTTVDSTGLTVGGSGADAGAQAFSDAGDGSNSPSSFGAGNEQELARGSEPVVSTDPLSPAAATEGAASAREAPAPEAVSTPSIPAISAAAGSPPSPGPTGTVDGRVDQGVAGDEPVAAAGRSAAESAAAASGSGSAGSAPVAVENAQPSTIADDQQERAVAAEADPRQADAGRDEMALTKSRIPTDMQGERLYATALRLETDAAAAYEEKDFAKAAGLYRDAAAAYGFAGTSRTALSTQVLHVSNVVDAALNTKDLERLRAIHPFYASDYYRNLFNVAESVSATTGAKISAIGSETATALSETHFVYRNNKNEEMEFTRSERWTFQEQDGNWRLVKVESV